MISSSHEEKWCAVTWKIKNFSYWAQEVHQDLRSPTFKTPATGNRLLELKLLAANKEDGVLVIRFHRIWGEPIFTPLVHEFAVLATNGTIENLPASHIDEHSALVVSDFIYMLPVKDSDILLPDDTLTLRLKIQHFEKVNIECFTRTVLHRDNFLWKVSNFNDLQPVVTKTFQLAYHQFVLNLYKNIFGPPNKNTEIQVVQQFGPPQSMLEFRFSIVSANGRELAKYQYSNFGTSSSNNSKYIKIEIRNDFLEDDMLFLEWEFIIGASEFMHEEKDVVSGLPLIAAAPIRNNVPNQSPSSGVLRKDLLCMYKDRKFCDATLKTEDASFHVHKSVLCARSPVFNDMFASDMEESRTSVVDIPDIQPDTMERMLMYLYTDFLEDIHFDEAYSLYYAADKYAILTLKEECLSVLKTELDLSNVCHALVLADTHQDERLMQSVRDFISAHDAVISSNEWKVLEESRPLLAIKLFRDLHYKKGKN